MKHSILIKDTGIFCAQDKIQDKKHTIFRI